MWGPVLPDSVQSSEWAVDSQQTPPLLSWLPQLPSAKRNKHPYCPPQQPQTSLHKRDSSCVCPRPQSPQLPVFPITQKWNTVISFRLCALCSYSSFIYSGIVLLFITVNVKNSTDSTGFVSVIHYTLPLLLGKKKSHKMPRQLANGKSSLCLSTVPAQCPTAVEHTPCETTCQPGEVDSLLSSDTCWSHLTPTVTVFVWLWSLPSMEAGEPYLQWWVNTGLLFITSTAQCCLQLEPTKSTYSAKSGRPTSKITVTSWISGNTFSTTNSTDLTSYCKLSNKWLTWKSLWTVTHFLNLIITMLLQ